MSGTNIGCNAGKVKKNSRNRRKNLSHKTHRPERFKRRREQIARRKDQRRRHHSGPPRSVLRKMLQPLNRAIELTINPVKERSWFPVLSVLTYILCGIYYHLFGLASMRDVVDKCKLLNFGSAARSTFSDAMNSKRRLKVIREVFQNLLLSFSDQISTQLRKFRHIAALDSTILHCTPKSLWAKYRKKVKACKAHVLFDLAKSIPKSLVVSAAKVHDRKFFELFLEPGWTYIVDRAYNVYSLFDAMIDLGIFFVTLLKSNATYSVIESKRVKRKHRKLGVLADEIILLGTGTAQMIHTLRLITFQTEENETLHFLTNRFDLAPTSVAALYRARWAIELFFKFLKRTLRCVRLLARSEIGAEIHVYLALITDLLLKCLTKTIGCWNKVKRHVPVTFVRCVRELLFRAWSVRLEVLLAESFP